MYSFINWATIINLILKTRNAMLIFVSSTFCILFSISVNLYICIQCGFVSVGACDGSWTAADAPAAPAAHSIRRQCALCASSSTSHLRRLQAVCAHQGLSADGPAGRALRSSLASLLRFCCTPSAFGLCITTRTTWHISAISCSQLIALITLFLLHSFRHLISLSFLVKF